MITRFKQSKILLLATAIIALLTLLNFVNGIDLNGTLNLVLLYLAGLGYFVSLYLFIVSQATKPHKWRYIISYLLLFLYLLFFALDL